MYIQPNSQIKLLKNVPLDTTFNHTILFSNASAQQSYFSSCAKYTLTQQSYQRVQKGAMYVQVNAENLYDCNYLMFQNTSFGSKWFYAFITGVEYVNNETSEVSFTIDPMQTYLFDVELKQCFVEREHSSTDVAGDNIVEEPISTGDIVCADIQSVDNMTTYVVMIWHAGLNTGDDVGGVYNNMFCGLDVEVAVLPDGGTNVNNLKQLLQSFYGKEEGIVSLTAMPQKFFNTTPEPVQYNEYLSAPTALVNGYTPRNKKLLTFPYNYLLVDCGNDTGVYRYEWFGGNRSPHFRLIGSASPNPQIACIPMNYNGVSSETGSPNITEELVMDGFPQLAYSIDGYRAYLAQSVVGATLNAMQNVFNGESSSKLANYLHNDATNGGLSEVKSYDSLRLAKNLFSGKFSSDAKSLLGGENSGVIGDFRRSVISAMHPNQAKGNMTNTVDANMRVRNFYFKQMCVSQNYAQIIDNFFDMFGYATKRVKIPNRSARPHWNYVKTNGAVVMGNAPADDVRAICQIYDNGITFWKNASEVGNYSLNNSLS